MNTKDSTTYSVTSDLGFKPILHWKVGSRWVTNANEMNTNNMKSTWPMPALCLGDPTHSTCLHWELAFGVTQILGLALQVTQILAFLDTHMLVYPTQESFGVLPNANPQHVGFCIAVEYKAEEKTFNCTV